MVYLYHGLKPIVWPVLTYDRCFFGGRERVFPHSAFNYSTLNKGDNHIKNRNIKIENETESLVIHAKSAAGSSFSLY